MNAGEPGKAEGFGRDYYHLFDYLRIVLAFGVFCAHAAPSGLLPEDLGNACVHVFFALSGFLIGGILLASKSADLPRFYFNRCTRIWVPYFIAIVLLFAATALRQSLRDPKLWEFFFYKATFVYNFFGPRQLAAFRSRMPQSGTGNHFWSICVEEQFYLVAPFLMVYLKRLRVPLLVGLIVLGEPNFASVAFGVLLAISKHKFGRWYESGPGRLACALVLVASGLILWRFPRSYDVAIGPASVAIVALTAVSGRPRPIGVVLGGMSYPFYLNHWIGLFVRKPISHFIHLGELPVNVAALGVALAFSYAHYRFVDRPIHERRILWFTRSRGMVACAVAIGLVVVGLAGGLGLQYLRNDWGKSAVGPGGSAERAQGPASNDSPSNESQLLFG
jgi:peptidoglycan/LPS O-acetylase OafA/YrhL